MTPKLFQVVLVGDSPIWDIKLKWKTVAIRKTLKTPSKPMLANMVFWRHLLAYVSKIFKENMNT